MLYLLLLLFKIQLFLTLLNVHHGYEVKDAEVAVNVTNSTNVTVAKIPPVSVPTEGGSVSINKPSTSSIKSGKNGHHVREHIVKNFNYSDVNSNSKIVSSSPVPLIDNVNLVTKINQDLGEGIPGKNDNKSVSSRKLTNHNFSTNNNNSTVNLSVVAVTKKPKKPTITEHDESFYALQASQGVDAHDKHETENSETSGIFNKAPITNSESQKYLIPIVAVILSVPFVAILISLIYKKGSDWWRYRHYRRMDFLINGMYDT